MVLTYYISRFLIFPNVAPACGHQGAQRPSVRLCLAHWATYNNIPYRLSDIVGMARCRDDVSPMDSSLRTLQRTLLLVAAYCRFEAVDKGWHDLVDVALDGNTKLGMDGLDSVLELLSGMFFPCFLTPPFLTKMHPLSG